MTKKTHPLLRFAARFLLISVVTFAVGHISNYDYMIAQIVRPIVFGLSIIAGVVAGIEYAYYDNGE